MAGLVAHQDALCSWWKILSFPANIAGLGQNQGEANRALASGTKFKEMPKKKKKTLQ